jgi:putative addiction module component (TIGR02574 family)
VEPALKTREIRRECLPASCERARAAPLRVLPIQSRPSHSTLKAPVPLLPRQGMCSRLPPGSPLRHQLQSRERRARVSAIQNQMDPKQVIEEAMRLPVDARAALAGQLLASLDSTEVDPGREAAWADEIQARLKAWESGSMPAVAKDEFLNRLERTARGTSAT